MSEIGIVEDGVTLARDLSDTARVGKLQEVLLSQDIVPEIILHLKDSVDPKEWKKAVAQLLLVNKAFFHSGIGVLWSSMDDIIPVFKLLPWFSESKCYSGIGYLSVELMTLPGRPDPFFPHLQHIAINPPATVRLPSIFIFVTPSLRSADVFPSHRISTPATGDVSAGQVLHLFDEWLAVFARIAALSIELQHFSYCGATSGKFWSILSRFTHLRSLRLSIKNVEYPESFHPLRRLPLLESLDIDALCLQSRTTHLSSTTSTQLHRLRYLSIYATAYHQFRIARSISPPQVRHLNLHVFKEGERYTFCQAVLQYLENNHVLETVNVEFSCSHLQEEVDPLSGWWARVVMQRLRSALDAVRKVQRMSFIDAPYRLATTILPMLCQSMARWNALTFFHFRIRLDDSSTSVFSSLSPFPGISFLATTVWQHCRQLQELELHFDRDMIVSGEDLEEPLESALPGTSPHPLRELTINTGTTLEESKKLELTAQRKVDIAMFFDRLFPKLEVVGGSAVELWHEVDVLVKGFQRQRRYFTAEMEGRLGGIRSPRAF
ncbi:hypothetical protein NMY22_g11244 [Coprinellus aureogranulatus]|nr:hypothetical protein NMY22_g11244 [Coprinellus aureogranulatus]